MSWRGNNVCQKNREVFVLEGGKEGEAWKNGVIYGGTGQIVRTFSHGFLQGDLCCGSAHSHHKR